MFLRLIRTRSGGTAMEDGVAGATTAPRRVTGAMIALNPERPGRISKTSQPSPPTTLITRLSSRPQPRLRVLQAPPAPPLCHTREDSGTAQRNTRRFPRKSRMLVAGGRQRIGNVRGRTRLRRTMTTRKIGSANRRGGATAMGGLLPRRESGIEIASGTVVEVGTVAITGQGPVGTHRRSDQADRAPSSSASTVKRPAGAVATMMALRASRAGAVRSPQAEGSLSSLARKTVTASPQRRPCDLLCFRG